MLTMAEKTFLGFVITLSATLVGIAVLPASSYEVSLVTNPNNAIFYIPAKQPFNITCKGSGDDEERFSSFKWLNNDGLVISEGIPGTTQEVKNSLTLRFTQPKVNESGVYKCEAIYDKIERLQKSVSIIFQENIPPGFDESYKKVTATENSYLEMICAAEGELPISFEWYDKDEKKITGDLSSSVYVSNRASNTSDLVIPRVSMKNMGSYTCVARNSHGSSSKIFELTVLPEDNGKPDETTSFDGAAVINVTTTSVKFTLTVTGPVERIHVKYREIRNSTDYEKDFKYGDVYEIKDLIPAGLYNFMFRTIPSSNNQYSRPYRVVLLPDTPEVIFREINSGTVKLEWSFKFEDRMRKTIDRHELTYLSLQRLGVNDTWKPSTCAVTIQILECSSAVYTISGLGLNVYYDIQLRAHTSSGYGKPYSQKIFMPGR